MTCLLKNARLLDAHYDHASLDVLVADDKIAAVGTELGPADREIDLTGYTVLPGFIDAHVHVAVFDHAFRDDAVRPWARNGVTTVRELGMLSVLSQEAYAKWLAQNNQNPETAHVIATGKYIDVAGGYGAGPNPNRPCGKLVTTPEEAADAVTAAYTLGYPGIKIGIHDGSMDTTPHLSPEMAKAICDRAHAHGMWVAAHIGNCKGAQFMLEAGVDELAHTPSDDMSDEMLQDMVRRGIIMDTTVGDPDKAPDMAPPPGMDGSGGPPDGMGPPPGGMPMDPEKMAAERKENQKHMRENLRRFYAAGGTIVAGTDLIHSRDYTVDAAIPVGELKQLALAGLPLQAIIATATANAARVVGTNEGILEPGRLANLIVVPGPVDLTFNALKHVKLVIHSGNFIRNELV